MRCDIIRVGKFVIMIKVESTECVENWVDYFSQISMLALPVFSKILY